MAKRSARSTTSSTSNVGDGKTVNRKKKRPKSKAMKRRETKIEAMKPKKPPTAFFYFLEDFRKEYQEQNPDVKSMSHIGKACGEKWKTMTYEENGEFDAFDPDLEDDSEFEI
ncbi:high mobility group B protein 14-like isoform X2 [Andrographis paniculata]|uniref:high mobility group B protein 14-like isoform X2 n=1 Tax=Andrographis paniculata TaxID=175694 RepID=UPI0021E8984B|nr:high mobility group B protein 14-like isoform X2 [Andrographis paniculata]XP_051128519.1 high mobility group B protein 14-like isoform X2 [Andrographis paniculata]